MKFLSASLFFALLAVAAQGRWVEEMKVEEESIQNLSMRLLEEAVRSAENPDSPNTGNIPAVVKSLGLTTLLEAVVKAGLAPTLSGTGPFTVFGPTNEAFTALPAWIRHELANKTRLAEILEYHVLPAKVLSSSLVNEERGPTVQGMPLRINIYKVNATNTVYTAQCAPIDLKRVDQEASNGVVHVLKGVILPPKGNIVVSLEECPVFKTLLAAAKIAGLVDALSGDSPLTLFAPTDAAFFKLPPAILLELLKDPKALKCVLLYHVVSGTQCSAGLTSGNVKTLNGKEVEVRVSPAGVRVNGANVQFADASVTNGVVHAIDKVLIPPNKFCGI